MVSSEVLTHSFSNAVAALVLTSCISVSFGLPNIFLVDLSIASSSSNSKSANYKSADVGISFSEVPLLKIATAPATAIATEAQ